jgi:hypothetical protein
MAGVGGRSGPAVSPAEAGCTRRAATEWRTRRSRVAARRGGTTGQRRPPPPLRVPEAQRRGAKAARLLASARSAASASGAAQRRLSRIRPAVAAACARACGPAAAAPSGRIERATRTQKRCDLWRLRRSAPVCAQLVPAFHFSQHRPALAPAIVIRTDRDAAVRLGDAERRRARSRRGCATPSHCRTKGSTLPAVSFCALQHDDRTSPLRPAPRA